MIAGKRLVSLLAGMAAVALVSATAMAGQTDVAKKKIQEARSLVTEVRQTTDDVGLWKSTLKILGNAEKSLEQGDYKAAVDAAEEAKFQARQGLKQYREEQEEWKTAANAASQNGDFKEGSWTGAD